MKEIKQNIPNYVTSLNLFSGLCSIIAAFNGEFEWAAWFIGMAAVFDFFDGLVARALGVSSELGKQLDSLADVVSFGVAPGLLMYNFAQSYIKCDIAAGDFCVNAYTGLVIPIFSAWRLAKFNIDTRQTTSFIGLPTPANALFFAALPLIVAHDNWGVEGLISNTRFLGIAPILMSFLLVAELPLFALKFKNFSLKDGETAFKLSFLLVSAALLLIFTYLGIPIIVILYVLLSLIKNAIKQK